MGGVDLPPKTGPGRGFRCPWLGFCGVLCLVVQRRWRVAHRAQSPLRWWPLALRAVWSPLAVLPVPDGDDHARCPNAPHERFVEAFIANLAAAALRIALLPRMPGGHAPRLGPLPGRSAPAHCRRARTPCLFLAGVRAHSDEPARPCAHEHPPYSRAHGSWPALWGIFTARPSDDTRRLRGLPLGEYAVRLVLHVRRFRCLDTTCTAPALAERLWPLGAPAAPHVRDRGHPARNLREVLERLLDRLHRQLVALPLMGQVAPAPELSIDAHASPLDPGPDRPPGTAGAPLCVPPGGPSTPRRGPLEATHGRAPSHASHDRHPRSAHPCVPRARPVAAGQSPRPLRGMCAKARGRGLSQ